jgi:hypothetical protein
MIDVMANLLVDIHPFKAKPTFFGDGNCFLNAFTVSVYSLHQMLLRVVADGIISSSRNAWYDSRCFRFDIVFNGIWDESNPNMRYRFHMSWWNTDYSKSLDSILERFVCHFNPYGSIWLSNKIFHCQLTIVIPWLSCIFRMTNTVSSTVELVNSVTSESINSFNYVRWALASKCFPIELVPQSHEW